MQAAADTDFQLEARFLSRPTQKFQMQGFFIEQDAQNWIGETHHDGSRLKAFAAVTVNGVSSEVQGQRRGRRRALPAGDAER